MKTLFRIRPLATGAAGLALSSIVLQAAEKHAKSRPPAEVEAATRLQVFLDRAEFAPGKIDGHYGEFTLKALQLYRQAHDEKLSAVAEGVQAAREDVPAKRIDDDKDKKGEAKPSSEKAPDVSGLDLASVGPVVVDYTVTDADLKSIGEVPEKVAAQAKLKLLPYRSAAEAIAEKFHTDVDFLAELNPGKTKEIKAGDTLKVPNVEPFDLAAVKSLKPGNEITSSAANEVDEDAEPKMGKGKADKKDEPAAPVTTSVKVDTQTNMLAVYEGEKLLAAYPVTIGSAQTESPVGEWKVRGVAKLPNFRYDEAMLKHGERSGDFHLLPPGPNNPVGVIWIQLNKKGIGLHGTSDPDAIGRSASHGCVRLANWDVVRLAAKVKAGAAVSIR